MRWGRATVGLAKGRTNCIRSSRPPARLHLRTIFDLSVPYPRQYTGAPWVRTFTVSSPRRTIRPHLCDLGYLPQVLVCEEPVAGAARVTNSRAASCASARFLADNPNAEFSSMTLGGGAAAVPAFSSSETDPAAEQVSSSPRKRPSALQRAARK